MERYSGVVLSYGVGAKRQYPRKNIIRVIDLDPRSSGMVVGWLVGWPESDPKIFGRIVKQHGRGGNLMVRFAHGLPGQSLGGRVAILHEKATPIEQPATAQAYCGSRIIEVEGIGSEYAEKLQSLGIETTSDLLEAGATPERRRELAEKAGISTKLILEWVNISDLFRVKGVGEEYADLLEEAGVDTVVELSTRNPENLHAKLVEVNEEKKIVKRVPSLDAVEGWVEEAKSLPRKIEY